MRYIKARLKDGSILIGEEDLLHIPDGSKVLRKANQEEELCDIIFSMNYGDDEMHFVMLFCDNNSKLALDCYARGTSGYDQTYAAIVTKYGILPTHKAFYFDGFPPIWAKLKRGEEPRINKKQVKKYLPLIMKELEKEEEK